MYLPKLTSGSSALTCDAPWLTSAAWEIVVDWVADDIGWLFELEFTTDAVVVVEISFVVVVIVVGASHGGVLSIINECSVGVIVSKPNKSSSFEGMVVDSISGDSVGGNWVDGSSDAAVSVAIEKNPAVGITIS